MANNIIMAKKKPNRGPKRKRACRIGKEGQELAYMDMKIRKAIPDPQKRLEYVQELRKYFDDTIEDITPARAKTPLLL